MSLNNSMNAAISGMSAAQNQLSAISNNIANASTPGYTRKTIVQETNVIPGTGIGGGVDSSNLVRQVDESLLRSYLNENSDFQNLNTQAEFLDQAQGYLGSPGSNNSVAHDVANLEASFEKYAAAVNDPNAKTELIDTTEYTLDKLADLSEKVQALRKEADEEIANDVEKANALLEDIDALNEEIVRLSMTDTNAVTDMEDKRDQALRELSSIMDISHYTRSNGEVVVMTTGGTTLLDTDVHKIEHSPMSSTNALSSVENGTIDGITVDGHDITSEIKSGEIAGLLEVRDEALPEIQSEIDELAYNLTTELNKAHNRGTAFPPPYELTGESAFTDPANQSIRIDDGDVKIIIFDQEGKQVSVGSLTQDIGFTQGNIYDPGNPDDPNTLAGAIEEWMQDPNGGNLPDANVYVNDDGGFVIESGDSTYGIGIVDESGPIQGSEPQDVKMSFDSDGDGVYDESAEGFSFFFGLNNYISVDSNDSVYESKAITSKSGWQVSTAVDISFSDTTNGSSYASVQVLPTDSLEDIVAKINADPNLSKNLNASVVTEGGNKKLQIINTSGEQLEITESPKAGLLSNLGLEPSSKGMATEIHINDNIKSDSNLIASGSANYNETTNQYIVSETDNSTANSMAEVFNKEVDFDQAGSTPKTSTTISGYANMMVTKLATDSSNASSHAQYKSDMVNTISMKEAEVSGVNMDQELSQLIIYQQAYSASANVFTASSEMLEILVNLGR